MNPQTDRLCVLLAVGEETTKWWDETTKWEDVLGSAPAVRDQKNPQKGPLGQSFVAAAEQVHSWGREHPTTAAGREHPSGVH